MENEKYINKNLDHSPVIRTSTFRFYEELNDHLPKKWKKQSFEYAYKGHPSIKNTIQALGVPHSEVDLILVNGVSVDFDYQLAGEEVISVYPVFESMDIQPVIRLRPQPLRHTSFIVDVNLGKLALKLRLLGFDTLFRNDLEDDEIVRISLDERRIILTRDRGILKQNVVTHGYWIRNDNPKKQLLEVIKRFQLQNDFKPFSRCSNCNGRLLRASILQLKNRVPEDTLSYYDEFWECNNCSKIYWQGSHFDHILKWLDHLKEY
ncbi:MAG TPA: Mut7-C RNAse domain-containing protein [Mariniphaga sp.]|nr:Mut7-C RNAse domain-containing protein [Mariniphaga sp.]